MRILGPSLALLALFSPACGSNPGRDEGATLTTTASGTTTSAESDSPTSTTTASGTTATTTASTTTTSTTTTSTTTTSTTDAPTSSEDGTTQDGNSSETGVIKLDLPPMDDPAIPVHEIPGLESITFYETTGKVTEYTFLVNGPELSTLLPDPLSAQNRDIQGTSVEFYDVYYSDEDGTFNADGSYLTIAGSFGAKLPAGGGLNLAEISLNSAIIA